MFDGHQNLGKHSTNSKNMGNWLISGFEIQVLVGYVPRWTNFSLVELVVNKPIMCIYIYLKHTYIYIYIDILIFCFIYIEWTHHWGVFSFKF